MRGRGERHLLGGALSPALAPDVGHRDGRAPGSHLVGGPPRARACGGRYRTAALQTAGRPPCADSLAEAQRDAEA